MTTYIDYGQLEEDHRKLIQFVEEELESTTYEQTVTLLKYTLNSLKPVDPESEKPEKNPSDYIG